MPSVAEASASASQLEAALKATLRMLDKEVLLTFTKYARTVLPLDGYVFWINTGTTFQVAGSLHYAADIRQVSDETATVNRIMFTCDKQIQEFNAVAGGVLWIATLGGQSDSSDGQVPGLSGLTPSPVLFAFSSRDFYFRKANLFHYVGTAVLPAMLPQLVNSAGQLPTEPIVGNSLPIWLSLTQFAPVYPSFLVPENAEPPYIVADIPPESTEALQAFANFDATPLIPPVAGDPLIGLNSNQLLKDRVRLTLYGFTSQTAIQYLQYLIQSSLNLDTFGFMNAPVIRDEKRVQSEIQAIAMKKTIDLEIDYFQQTSAAIALRLILSATASFTVHPSIP